MFSPDQKPVFGEKTKKFKEIFEQNNADNWLTSNQLRKCLHFFDIYPAESQVVEYVHDACQISGRLEKKMSFGEFCYVVSVLDEEYKIRSASGKSPGTIPPKCKQCGDYIFLGGSCNPTTWRADTVIPFLKKHNLTFYNPQRDDWSEELVQQETEAKDRAEVLFFVIDNVTRSTASMVESANLAAKGKPLILIIKRFDGPHKEVAGEKLSEIEYEDLCRSHAYLTHLVERRGIPVFSDIIVALECLRRVLHEDIPLEELTLKDGAIPVKHPHVRISDKFRRVKEAFAMHGAEHLNRDQINDAFKFLTSADLPKWIWHSSGPEKEFTLEEFYCLVAEFKNERQLSVASILRGIVRIPIVIYDWFLGRPQNCPELIRTKSVQDYDIFLGGTCADSVWREEIAIPLLEKAGLTYYNPKKQEWTTRYIAREASVKDHCKTLLYVITSQSRGITSMLEAAYYSGLGRKVIFCILSINTQKICGEELTENAIKDYNRARTYLFEITQECPHFQTIEEAVEEAIRTVQEQKFQIS